MSVIQSASKPEAVLKKKHTALAFHHVHECVAVKIITPFHIDGKDNFADILTKPLGGTVFKHHVWDLLWHTSTWQ
jgi:hypothetical protein